jgi:hypothetical protein
MKAAIRAALGVSLVVALAAPAAAQIAPPPAGEVNLAGPRFGLTFLSDGVVQKLLRDDKIEIAPVVSQFGWQFEKQFYGRHGGPSAITEAVVLVGGLEQGVVLPSLSWLVGVRTADGFEFGVGPNITPVGTALVAAMGKTFRVGVLNVPVNIAVVPSKSGLRVSFLTGFALRR